MAAPNAHQRPNNSLRNILCKLKARVSRLNYTPKAPVLYNVTVFKGRTFKEVTKVKF